MTKTQIFKGMAAALLVIALPVTAQTTTAAQEKTAATTTSATTTAAPALEEQDSRETREELMQLLHRYPPEVAKVLKLDPTLFANQTYLASYPALVTFLTKHPEVANSPRFYLDRVWVPGDETPETGSVKVWRDTMEAVSIFTVILIITGALTWLIRTLIEHRRWSRLSRIQAEVHNKLLDRFVTNEDLLAYIQTSAGKRYLESAPIPLESEPRAVSAPIGRILWAVQIGVVLAAAGIGLQFVSTSIQQDVSQPIFAMGILGICIGGGFVLSAVVSYFLSRKLGLWVAPPSEPGSEGA